MIILSTLSAASASAVLSSSPMPVADMMDEWSRFGTPRHSSPSALAPSSQSAVIPVLLVVLTNGHKFVFCHLGATLKLAYFVRSSFTLSGSSVQWCATHPPVVLFVFLILRLLYLPSWTRLFNRPGDSGP
ncbi:unnamed protein product [Soboliphyme baturini]|uniref:Secreted protein n=1 Tax=Soboliphyme baturini TaxID=241478 RepID=A0A183J5Q1_9BILA|nr:unnamed protein product [Soboliphyme baturini]